MPYSSKETRHFVKRSCFQRETRTRLVRRRAGRSGPIRLHSSPRFLSEVSAATYAASLPVGSITA